MTYQRKEVIGDCTLRKKQRARGHGQAQRLYPTIGDCERCGHWNAERHHVDDNPLNNAPENIMALCRRCHTVEHGKAPTPEIIAMGVEAAAKKRRAITHCKRGHPYAGENLYVTPQGKRVCKQCRLIAKRKYRAGGGRG